jgi:hypothetical protein
MKIIVTVGEILHALKLAQDALHMATLPFPVDEVKTIRALEAVTKVCDALEPTEKLAQPERKWVGLTREEIKEISFANRPYVVDMAMALEARLKEKNYGR